MLDKSKATLELLKQVGYDADLLQDFYDLFAEALCLPANDIAGLENILNTEYMSDTIVCYLRLVTAAILKRDVELYEGFILDSFSSLQEFIATQVEPSKH